MHYSFASGMRNKTFDNQLLASTSQIKQWCWNVPHGFIINLFKYKTGAPKAEVLNIVMMKTIEKANEVGDIFYAFR